MTEKQHALPFRRCALLLREIRFFEKSRQQVRIYGTAGTLPLSETLRGKPQGIRQYI
jgi:hypothetical protein